jgi:hypothetical protein
VNHRILIVLFTIILLSHFAHHSFAQEAFYSARVVDRTDNEYLLDNFRRYEYDFFNCRLRDVPFKLSFEKILSIDFVEEADTTVKGYTLATVTLVDGNTTAVYLSSDSVVVNGRESNFTVELTIPLGDVKTITFVRE